jgi:hypothetical protein
MVSREFGNLTRTFLNYRWDTEDEKNDHAGGGRFRMEKIPGTVAKAEYTAARTLIFNMCWNKPASMSLPVNILVFKNCR